MSTTRLKKAGAFTAAGALAIALIGGFEGVRLNSYKDVVGIPTVCFGETRGVKMGDSYTMSECKDMFGKALIEFETSVRYCLKDTDRIPDKTYVSYLSLAYNIGASAFCKSSVAKLANQKDYKNSCKYILIYNKARVNGKLRIVKGLDTRRKEESKLCLEGLK